MMLTGFWLSRHQYRKVAKNEKETIVTMQYHLGNGCITKDIIRAGGFLNPCGLEFSELFQFEKYTEAEI